MSDAEWIFSQNPMVIVKQAEFSRNMRESHAAAHA